MRLVDSDALPIKTTWHTGARIVFERDLDAAPTIRCDGCEHWDHEYAETVANVAFAYCNNKIATKEFKSSVVSEGWLCPCYRPKPADRKGE